VDITWDADQAFYWVPAYALDREYGNKCLVWLRIRADW